MTESRRYARLSENARVTVRVQSAPGLPKLEGQVFKCSSHDVSENGVRLKVDVSVPPGSLLELEIMIGDPKVKYRFMGTTIWAEKPPPKGGAGNRKTSQIGVELKVTGNAMTESWNQALKKLRG